MLRSNDKRARSRQGICMFFHADAMYMLRIQLNNLNHYRKHYVNSTPHLDFLKDKFADVPDLPEQPAKCKPGASRPTAASKPVAAPKARKRQR